MTHSTFARSFALLATTGLLAATASPAFARNSGPATVTVTSKAVQDSTSRLCMPKTTLGKKADRAMPDTICQTRAEWEAAGVTFKVK